MSSNKIQEDKYMNDQKNSAISCSVKECKYNLGTESYCTLSNIRVGTHETNPSMPECTDCQSFVKKNC